MSTPRRNSKREIRRRIYEIMKVANKGLLLVPLSAIPEGMSAEEFAEAWRKQDGGCIMFLSRTALPEVTYYPDTTPERLKKTGVMTLYDLRKIRKH